jgi:hypothetical protein
MFLSCDEDEETFVHFLVVCDMYGFKDSSQSCIFFVALFIGKSLLVLFVSMGSATHHSVREMMLMLIDASPSNPYFFQNIKNFLQRVTQSMHACHTV